MIMKKILIALMVLHFVSVAVRGDDLAWLKRFNVVWDSPSKDCQGSMPLGNGDIGVNAWAQVDGSIHIYISKTDSWDDNARIVKVGKIVVRFAENPFSGKFRQELDLKSGSIIFQDKIILWVDANRPVIHLTTDLPATASIELWRTGQYTLPSIECSDVMNGNPKGTSTVVEPDTVLTGQVDRIGWYHRNIKSVGPKEHAEVQGMTGYQREDPLLHRTFGALITAPDANRVDDTHLQSEAGFDIYVLTRHPATPEQWLASVEKLVRPAKIPDYRIHKKWWAEFWDRSWICATSNTNMSSSIAGVVPANSMKLKVGEDQTGQSKFAGEIRNIQLPKDFSGPFTLEAEVNPSSGEKGRIFDKITPGGRDGFLVDTHPGNCLRLISGAAEQVVENALPAGQWAKVTARVDASGWNISVNGESVISTVRPVGTGDAEYVSQMFALQRFITACAGRGAYPIKFNGSIFTVAHPGRPGDADYRQWGPGYWWQNTRLPYISMCANGDFEMMEPLWRMYVDQNLPLNKYRTKKYFGFDDAAYFIECIHFWGDVFNESYGWTPVEQREDKLQVSGWHKREWVAGPELVWMMLDNYEYTLDKDLLEKRIIPAANAIMRFFDCYYKTNAEGQLVMHPSQALETWWDCTNPMPELAGLRAITERLLALPESVTPKESREYWKTLLAKLPPLPTRNTPTGSAYAPATKFDKKSNCENPELYCVFPFRLCSFEKENRELGVNAMKNRWDSGNSGWWQNDIFSAYLGLTGDARRGLVDRSRNSDKGSRFPAFWGPNFDWIPDQDHGGVLMKAFQAMLMQTEGDKIFLLPAWPKDWDVFFKLHAPKKTTVECRFVGGKVVDLKVTPKSRRKDVEIVGCLQSEQAGD